MERSSRAGDNMKWPFKKKDEENPWDIEEKPKVTDEELDEAIEQTKKPKTKLHGWKLDQILLIPWFVFHVAGVLAGLAGVLVGVSMAVFILLYALVSLYFSSKYFLLIREVKQK